MQEFITWLFIGAGCFILYWFFGLIQIANHRVRVGFWGTTWLFSSAIILVGVGVAVRQSENLPDNAIAVLFAMSLVMIVFGFGAIWVERNKKGFALLHSRGVLSMGVGIMVKTATKLFAAQKESSLYALMATVAAKSKQSQKEKAAPKKYDHISFTPPKGVSEEAKRGLELRKEYGRGGTPIGVKRAVQLSNRDTISPETARRMYKFFIRHEKNKDSVTPSGKPGNGMIAWKLWGGDAGQAWAGKLWRQMEAADADGQGKAVDNFRKKIDDISLSEFRRRLRKALETLEKQYTDAAVTELLSVMEMGYQSQLVLPFNMPNEDRIQALYEQGRNRRPLILEERGLNSFADISKTTNDAIVKRVAFGVTENQTLEEIARDINKYFDELTPARAMTIARTEVLTAASLGQAAAMADAAEVIPDLRKAWFSGRDERTRGNPDGLYPKSAHDHWSMNGQVKRQDQPFVDPRSGIKLDYPRDPEAGDAGAVINCRCSMIVFPAAEAASFGIKLDVESMGRSVD